MFPIPERYLALAATCLIALCLFLFFSAVQAKDPDGRYAQSPHHDWYESQHNSVGQWCCNESDGHPYEGDYAINQDGSVTVENNYRIESYKVLRGPNPTGHPVWWYVEGPNGRTTFCFALGAGT